MNELYDPSARLLELLEKGYDFPAIARFARAERSWTERGSNEWNLWHEIEKLACSKGATSF